MNRIVCVGNPLRDGDGAGAGVYALLTRTTPPPGVEVVDGGLAGLDLLRFMQGARTVVFVDSVHGFGAPGEVVILGPSEVGEHPATYDHAGGLCYLLAAYPAVLDPPLPSVRIVGVEEPAGAAAIDRAARAALSAALENGCGT